MTHPNAYDSMPMYRVAIFALWSRYRLRLWELPGRWQHRIMGVAIDAMPNLEEVAVSVCREAKKLVLGRKQ